MKKLRYGLIVMWLLMCSVISAEAQLSIGIGLPNVSIGINLPVFPVLTRVPGYPVYYAPQMDANYFFYDGMYWIYQNDNWYASSWYNGPWGPVDPEYVPLFILRVPVRYYRQPPVYFQGWQSSAPPRWGQHWGHGWEQKRSGWDTWKRSSAPAPAPLPTYQKKFSGERYPRPEQQHQLRGQNYRYQPRDKVVREHFRQQAEHRAPAADQHQQRDQRPQPDQRQQREQRPQVDQRQQYEQRQQREQQPPRAQEREQRQQDRGEGRGQGQGRDDDRGRGRDK